MNTEPSVTPASAMIAKGAPCRASFSSAVSAASLATKPRVGMTPAIEAIVTMLTVASTGV